jgi:Eukaryotic aspartyl protease
MPNIARVPITNIYMGGDYTGLIMVGPGKKPMNVILDTGSSALALDGTKYSPSVSGGDQVTNLAQTDSYGDGSSWTGAVLKSDITVGGAGAQVKVTGASVAVAYEESASMFRKADGILGLAYAPLDDAFQMPDPTWPKRYTSKQIVNGGKQATVVPFLTQLAVEGLVSDKISFYTKRSFIHEGAGGGTDPLNQGWMILGGGEESTDLYTGAFQTAKILADDWYNTNLKAVTVGTSAAIKVAPRGPRGMPSNSIVDSGTNTLNLGPKLLAAVVSKFSAAQQGQLEASIFKGSLIPVADLNLAEWPNITFVLQGDAADVTLVVGPGDYWQVNAPKAGSAMAAISQGQEGLAILGLPLMNGYFTIFDGEADGGRGAIKFAASKR